MSKVFWICMCQNIHHPWHFIFLIITSGFHELFKKNLQRISICILHNIFHQALGNVLLFYIRLQHFLL